MFCMQQKKAAKVLITCKNTIMYINDREKKDLIRHDCVVVIVVVEIDRNFEFGTR